MHIRSLFLIIFAGLLTTASTQRVSAEEQEQITRNAITNFGTTASNVVFYYADVEAATKFYSEVLGLRVAADYGFAKIIHVSPKSFITLMDASKGMHTAYEPKTAAISLITDQMEEWWDYISTQDIPIRDSFDPVEGRTHHTFTIIDPEGYFLEFERFNKHEQTRMLTPILDRTATLYAEAGKSSVPPGLGFKATLVWFYYNDMRHIQQFYEDVLFGPNMIVDQGCCKIYQIGPSGYLGLVDEKVGMHRFTKRKAVTLSFITAEIDDWYAYLDSHDDIQLRSHRVEVNERHRSFVAYDAAGYYLQWIVFSDVPINAQLLRIIEER